MTRSWTLAAVALPALAMVGCGNSSSTPTLPPRALVKLTFPEPIVAVPSTDSGFAMEASVPMVASETAGVNAYPYQMRVETTAEATGVTNYAKFVVTESVEKIPAGGSVEIPFRVYLSSMGPHRAKVLLDTTDASTPVGVPTGSAAAALEVLWGTVPTGERGQWSGEFRILPPQ